MHCGDALDARTDYGRRKYSCERDKIIAVHIIVSFVRTVIKTVSELNPARRCNAFVRFVCEAKPKTVFEISSTKFELKKIRFRLRPVERTVNLFMGFAMLSSPHIRSSSAVDCLPGGNMHEKLHVTSHYNTITEQYFAAKNKKILRTSYGFV
jgi:hypothetical protein